MVSGPEALWNTWQGVTAIIFALASIILSIIYLFASVLENEKLKSWVKMEVYEIIYSGILISIMFLILNLVDDLVNTLMINATTTPGPLGTPTSTYIEVIDTSTTPDSIKWEAVDLCETTKSSILQNPFSPYRNIRLCSINVGIWFLREIFREAKILGHEVMIEYGYYSVLTEFRETKHFLAPEKTGVISSQPLAFLVGLTNKIRSTVFDWAIRIMVITKFQEITLRFIAVALFPIFLISGIILRILPITRKLGGLLMAMAFVLYYIYPFFYAIAGLIVLDIQNSLRDKWVREVPEDVRESYGKNPPVFNFAYGSGNILLLNEEIDVSQIRKDFTSMGPEDAQQLLSQRRRNLNPRLYSEQEIEELENKTTIKISQWQKILHRMNLNDPLQEEAFGDSGPIGAVGRLLFWSLFFGFLSVIATIASIRSLSITLGGDIEIAGLTRLI